MTRIETAPPILLDLPDELLGERVLVRPPHPGDGATVWEAVEESREQITPWLPWVAKTLGPDDCEAAARRGADEGRSAPITLSDACHRLPLSS
jgi:hypothetical protein